MRKPTFDEDCEHRRRRQVGAARPLHHHAELKAGKTIEKPIYNHVNGAG